MKKILSVLMCICIIASMAAIMSGCNDEKNGEYPVTIGTLTIKEEPQNIVVLSDCMADIISYIGYDVKMVGRDLETDQDFLKVVPIVGTADNPNIDTIVNAQTDVVIADERLNDAAKAKLIELDIPVITCSRASSFEELERLYTTLGTFLGGNITGKAKGKAAFDELKSTLKSFKDTVPGGILKTACYLYLDENDNLCTIKKGTIEAELFAYCGAVNIFPEQETEQIDTEHLRVNTPTFIFYDDEAVADILKNSPELSVMTAVRTDNMYQIKKTDFDRQGTTYEDMIYHMIGIMFMQSDATPDEATPDEAVKAYETAEDVSVTPTLPI